MQDRGRTGGWERAARAAARPGARWRDDRGQGLVEYALILMFVGLVVMGVLLVFGQNVSGLFTPVIAAL